MAMWLRPAIAIYSIFSTVKGWYLLPSLTKGRVHKCPIGDKMHNWAFQIGDWGLEIGDWRIGWNWLE